MISVFSLYKGHFKNSKKILFYSSIGLIIALTLVSSSLYFIDNSRQQLFTSSFNSKANFGNDIVAQMTTNFKVGNSTERITKISNSISGIIDHYKFDFINQSQIKISTGYGNFQVVLPVTNENGNGGTNHYLESSPTIVYQLTPYFKQELEKIHASNSKNTTIQFPTSQPNLNNSNLQAFMVYINNPYNYYSPIDTNSMVKNGNMSVYYPSPTQPGNFSNYNFSIVGYDIFQFNPNYNIYSNTAGVTQKPTQSSYTPFLNGLLTGSIASNLIINYYLSHTVQGTTSNIRSILFVSNITQFGELIQKSYGSVQPPITNNYIIHIGFAYNKIDLSRIESFLAKENYFYSTFQQTFLRQGYTAVTLNFISTQAFYEINYEIQNLTASFFITDLPILIISFFLANYCFNLIYKNIVRNISIYKTRGASTWLILGFQLIDLLVIIGISILSSLLLGIPISVLSLKTNYLFSFNNPSPVYYIFKYESIAGSLFLWGLLFIVVNNFNRVRNLSKISIAETENPNERTTPFWQNHYLDVIMFGFGSVMLAFFYLLIHDYGLVQTFGSVLQIISLLIIPGPFCFVIGLSLMISRLIPIILNRVGTFLWDVHGGLTAYSFKNILRYKNATIRGILLISVVIAFLLFFYSSPYSMIENYKQTTNYKAGSDGTAIFNGSTVDLHLIHSLQNKFSQYIDSTSAFVVLNVGSLYNNQINFLLINTSTYVQSANLNFDLGLKNNIQKDFKDLAYSGVNSTSAPINILVNQELLKPNSAKVGSNITISNNINAQHFRIQDTFTHWPFLEPNFKTPYYAIGDINYFYYLNQSINNSIFSNIYQTGLFIHWKQNVNLTLAISQIQDSFPITFKYVPKLSVNYYIKGFSYLSVTGQVNLNILLSLLIIFVIILLFIQFQISERKKEIYTERAYGMKTSQLIFIFYVENMILLVFSLILGTIIGMFFVQLVGFITQSPIQSYPPNVTVIPFDIVFLSNVLILITGIILSIIPAILISRQDISKSFISEM